MFWEENIHSLFSSFRDFIFCSLSSFSSPCIVGWSILISTPPVDPWVKCLGYKNFSGGAVLPLQGGWVTFYIWQAHGCTSVMVWDWMLIDTAQIATLFYIPKAQLSCTSHHIAEAGPKAGSNWECLGEFGYLILLWSIERQGGKNVCGTEPLECKWHSESIPFFLCGFSRIS